MPILCPMLKISTELSNKSQRLFGLQIQQHPYIKKAKGSHLYDFDNNKYIDFYLNNGAFILGHANPIITRYIKNYVNKGFFHSLPSNIELKLASTILEIFDTYKYINFSSSKIELLDKLIALCGSKKNILLIGNKYKIIQVNYTKIKIITYKGNFIFESIKGFIEKEYKKLSSICLDRFSFAENNYGKTFWNNIKELCSKYKLKIIIDEETTAFRLSHKQTIHSINPDYTILGNVIAGGFPLWALLTAKQKTFEKLKEIEYNGLPLYYIAGLETIKYLRRTEYQHKLEDLINILEREITNTNISIKSTSSIFSIEYKKDTRGIPPNTLLKNNIFLNPKTHCPQFLSTTHNIHSIKHLAKALNSL